MAVAGLRRRHPGAELSRPAAELAALHDPAPVADPRLRETCRNRRSRRRSSRRRATKGSGADRFPLATPPVQPQIEHLRVAGASIGSEPGLKLGATISDPHPNAIVALRAACELACEPEPARGAADRRVGSVAHGDARRLQPSSGRLGLHHCQRPLESDPRTTASRQCRAAPRRLRLGRGGAAIAPARNGRGQRVESRPGARSLGPGACQTRPLCRFRFSRSSTTAATSMRRRWNRRPLRRCCAAAT